jgi:mono/diheme cytochrome c family protein
MRVKILGSRSVLRALHRVLWLAGSSAVLVAVAAQQADPGRALFEAYGCYQCHGHAGQGGAAPRIAPSAYPLQAFVQFVRRPSDEMPAYPSVALSDAELESIYRYVRSVPEPPAAEEISILR